MSAYTELENWLVTNGYDLDDYDLPDKGKIIYEFFQENRIQVPQFKDNRKSLYSQRGYKVKDALLSHKENNAGDIYMSFVELGDVPLKSPKTVALAKKLESLIVEPDAPRRVKLEHGLTRNNLVHSHYLFSSENPPPKKVKIGSQEYTVNTVKLGDDERWAKYPYDEQLKRAVTYLYKPSNVAGTEGHKKLDLKYQAYLEWFLEQRDLHSMTPNERKKLTARIAWNKNIKVRE